MNRTALIPLGVFLLVIILATILVSHYEKVYVQNLSVTASEVSDNSSDDSSAININKLSDIMEGENIAKKDNAKPDLYIYIYKAKQMLADGMTEESESTLKTILVFYPDNIESLTLLAGIYCVKGRYKLANDLLKKVLKLEPDNYAALENLGIVMEQQKKYKSAIGSFFKASLIKPESSIAYLHMAKLYSLLNDKEQAIENFNKAYKVLGNRIYPFTYTSAFDNIRDMPEFVEILHKSRPENAESDAGSEISVSL